METETLPAHVTFDKSGSIENIVILNPRTKGIEFHSTAKKTFQDIGNFLGAIKEPELKI